MECSCSIDVDGETYEDCHDAVEVAKGMEICGECGKAILPGEYYENYSGLWDGDIYEHQTCLDCLSLRDNFFGDWQFGMLWETFQEHMYYCEWRVPEKCLVKCTTDTRAKIYNMVEEYWRDTEDGE